MLRIVALSLCSGLLAALVLVQPTSVQADGKELDTETIMKKLNGKNGTHKVVNKALGAATPDWDAISKETKVYAEYAAALGKNKADKGDAKAWDKLCKEYAEAAADLNKAAGKKDKDAAKTAMGKLNESCDACHENHR